MASSNGRNLSFPNLDLKAKRIYFSDISNINGLDFSGRVFVYLYTDNPTISEFKIEELEDLLYHKRVKAVYYGDNYGMIPFYSEKGNLVFAIQFVPNDKKRIEAKIKGLVSYLLIDSNKVPISREDAAILAAHVYGEKDSDYKKYDNLRKRKQWVVCEEFNDIVRKEHDLCGFRSNLYKKGNNIYCYVTAGTEGLNLNDWKTNAGQIFGKYLYQYIHSVSIAKKLQKKIKEKGGTLCFVGHSLGGGLATCNALATGCYAKTFNPAGISNATVNEFNNSDYDDSEVVIRVSKEKIDELIINVEEASNSISHLRNRIKLLEQKKDETSLSQLIVLYAELKPAEDAYNEALYEYNEKVPKYQTDIYEAQLLTENYGRDNLKLYKENQNITNYVIFAEFVDVANNLPTINEFGNYIMCNFVSSPYSLFDNHSINSFLKLFGLYDEK